jgi:hypothetical protein
MHTFVDILNLACGRWPARPIDRSAEVGPARRGQLLVGSFLYALAFAAVWGLAAGSRSITLAVADLFKVPLVVLLSSLCAVPAGVLALRLSRASVRARDLLLWFASAVLSGTLVLAALAPLVAIYYHTIVRTGATLAIGSVLTAIVVSGTLFVRNVLRETEDRAALVPACLLVALVVIALVQFVALASPILGDATIFDGGIDRLLPSW